MSRTHTNHLRQRRTFYSNATALSVCGVALFLLLTLGMVTTTHAQTTCNVYNPSISVPTGYGASYNVFNTSEMMISILCNEDQSITVTSGNNDPLTYIYNQGYWYDATAQRWVNFTYSCSGLIADAWCVGQVSKTLTSLPTADVSFLVSYTCQWSGTKWNCGCSNTSCSTHAWQLQGWTPPATGGGAHFDNVPIPSGQMDFSWFDTAKASIPSTTTDDPVSWTSLYSKATTKKAVDSCTTLQAALDTAGPGTMILVGDGTYSGCSVNFTKSGTASNPIVLTAEHKALGRSGGVTFSGGNRFGNFQNKASYYVVGGFAYVGQNYGAITLVRPPANESGSTNIRFTDSQFEGIGIKKGSLDAVILAKERSHNVRIDHNSFVGNYNHVRFNSNDPWDGTTKNARIDHNYFGQPAGAGFLSNIPYEMGALQTCCGHYRPEDNLLTLTFEYNVIEIHNGTYVDPERIEIKSNGATIRNNIFWAKSTGAAIAFRYNHHSVADSNYLVDSGIKSHGVFNKITNNRIVGEGVLKTGIEMPRWGRRKPTFCNIVPETRDNIISNNTISGTYAHGIRLGDCDYGACRPLKNITVTNNTINPTSGNAITHNADEPGRPEVCDATTMPNQPRFWDQSGDADGGTNTGIVIN